jgi:hypothetical protein
MLSLLGPGARAAEWTVIFRGDDPKSWNTDSGDESADNGFAIALKSAPKTVHYLRLKRMDSGDAVIVAITRLQLGRSGGIQGDLIWTGNSGVRGPADNQCRLLGIARKSWPTGDGDLLVNRARGEADKGYRGWGFSKAASSDTTQTYSWNGDPIGKTIFEIAVTDDDLTEEERKLLLDAKANTPSTPSDAPQVLVDTPPRAVSIGDAGTAPTTQISKMQTSIEALYVIIQPDGGVLGSASRFILTATPGESDHNKPVPVSFTSAAGSQMYMVLDDVARTINLRYRLGGIQKIELSFEDKYVPHDGGSIGAAIGTLMLSMIQGFDIDPNLAITGDVSADGKVRAIGGVAAKLRGAAAAGCTVVAVPNENFDQVQDAMVYAGPSIVSNVNVLGISSLDDAAATARTDRAAKLAKAIDVFGQFEQSMKDSPDFIYTDAAAAQLQQVLELAPNDLSAKLLMLVSQHRVPRLSARASEYYTIRAVQAMWDTLDAKGGAHAVLTDAAIDETLKELKKVRPLADLTIRPWIDSWIDFLNAGKELRAGDDSTEDVDEKYQTMVNEAVKLDTNRDLAEKMLHEGM